MKSAAERLLEIADRVGGLTVSRRDPERFYADREACREDLRRIAESLSARVDAGASRGRFAAGRIVIKGRVVVAEARKRRSPRAATALGSPKTEAAWPGRSSANSAKASSPTSSATSTPSATSSASN